MIDPTLDQIEVAIREATPAGSQFVSLAYINAGLEIEVVQATAEGDVYRIEALPPENSPEDGKIYVNDGVAYEDVVKVFEAFYQRRAVFGYRDWMVEKNS